MPVARPKHVARPRELPSIESQCIHHDNLRHLMVGNSDLMRLFALCIVSDPDRLLVMWSCARNTCTL